MTFDEAFKLVPTGRYRIRYYMWSDKFSVCASLAHKYDEIDYYHMSVSGQLLDAHGRPVDLVLYMPFNWEAQKTFGSGGVWRSDYSYFEKEIEG